MPFISFRLFVLFVLFLYACQSPRKKTEAIVQDFDSVNRSLDTYNKTNRSEASLYDSLLQRAFDRGGGEQQLYYKLTDFHGYLKEFRRRFLRYAGADEDDRIPPENESKPELVTAFLQEQKGVRFEQFTASLQQVMNDLRSFAHASGTLERIQAFQEEVSSERLSAAFRKLPPVAFSTLLQYYDKEIKKLELEVLKEL